ncbi:hypothetical protein BGX24_004304, partial [Mortierella sp. AD032]
MKFLSQRLAPLMVIASVTCFVSMRSVSGEAIPDAVVPSQQDFEALGHGHKKHHGHHQHGHHKHDDHHHGHPSHDDLPHHKHQHKKPHHKHHHHLRPHHEKPHDVERQIKLKCSGTTVDKIDCPRKFVPMVSADDQTSFDALNNGGKIQQVCIHMDLPCSKDLPADCARGVTEFETTNNGHEHKKHNHHNHDHNGKHDHDHDQWQHEKHHHDKHNHDDRHHDKHNHDSHHHDNRHHDNGHDHHIDNDHPYQDLCVAVGDFCGSELYGCNFDAKTRYRCTAIGKPPGVLLVDAKICGGNNEDPATALVHLAPTQSVGPIFTGLAMPLPTRFTTAPCIMKPSPEGVVCGSNNCNCKGDIKVCSNQFKDECEYDKNAILQCSPDGGRPKTIHDCKDSESCVSLGDNAVCVSKNCKCPSNGIVCGQVFPLSCRKTTTAFYTCEKGKDPVLSQDCYPARCTTSRAAFAVSAIFKKSDAANTCTSQCLCAGKGPVCGSTFDPACEKEASTLYMCEDGAGTETTDSRACREGGCIVNNGDDVCKGKEDSCLCKSSADMCGSDFPKDCRYIYEGTIYNCKGGAGSKPIPGDNCAGRGECSVENNVGKCKDDTCLCKKKGDVCGSEFPKSCPNIKDDTIYDCKNAGLDPIPGESCTGKGECKVENNVGKCKVKDGTCLCKKKGDVCGSEFPKSCPNIKDDTIYDCKNAGLDPIPGESCTGKGECKVENNVG